MSVVTIAEAWPAVGRPFTVADLDRIPITAAGTSWWTERSIVSPRPTRSIRS